MSPAPSAMAEGGCGEFALHVEGLSKTFAGKTVLHPFELSVARGHVHMLLGQNGSGKSTFLKLLAGFYEADVPQTYTVGNRQIRSGSADRAREAGLRFVHQDLALIGSATVLENMLYTVGFPTSMATISTRRSSDLVSDALEQVGLDIDPRATIDSLSPAQRTGIAVARALMRQGDPVVALVLDEPTATLPGAEVERLHDTLRTATEQGLGVLYVTHHLEEVDQLGDTVSVLRDGRLVAAGAVGELRREKIVHALVGGELEQLQKVASEVAAPIRPDHVLDVDGVVGDRLSGLTFDASAGEIVGLYGLTGSGRETALETIFGARDRSAGSVRVGSTTVRARRPRASMAAGMAYVPADRKTDGLFLALTAQENLTLGDLRRLQRRGRIDQKAERREVQEWFDRLDIRPADGSAQPVGTFSGGNQQKIVMAKWLRLEPKVLLLDEPTQGVDVGAKAELHRQILQTKNDGAAIVVSSSDVDELVTLCDRVLIVRHGQVYRELVGEDVTDHNINHGFLEASTHTNG